jgi:hypothetical protein
VLVVAGKVRVFVPATPVACNVILPEVDPVKLALVPTDKVVSTVADPYIRVPDDNLAIYIILRSDCVVH